MKKNTFKSFFGRKNSAPTLTLHPEKSPVNNRRNSSLPNVLETNFESLMTLRKDGQDEFPLFSVYAETTVQLESTEHLKVNKGDLITVLYTGEAPRDYFQAQNGNTRGKIALTDLELNRHSENIYLEVMDFLYQHPPQMCHLLSNFYPEIPNHCSELVSLLCARRLLPKTLLRLCQIEYESMSTNTTKINETFRSNSPAILLISAMLQRKGKLSEFRTQYIQYIIASIRLDSKKRTPHPTILSNTLKKCVEYLSCLPPKDIPPELILIMRTVKEAGKPFASFDIILPHLGAIFFLRFICPALTQPEELLDISGLTDPLKDNLKALAKALQYIANKTSPPEDWSYYTAQTQEDMENLYKSTDELLTRIASFPITPIIIENSLLASAASYYWLVSQTFSQHPDAECREALKQLQERLGQVPLKTIAKDENVPLIEEITKISRFIEESKASLASNLSL